jgi:hypothetical protein
MLRIIVTFLIALACGTSAGQMMGGSISTSQYFPLVDGARYDYAYTAGPWATSTAIMHAGQTWAGVSGLTAMHTSYVCVASVSCAPDATDFYRMDPDGMHYFGGTGASPNGNQFSVMIYTNPEWPLKNPVAGTMMAGGGFQNMEAWHAGVTGTGSMMGGQNYTSSYQALALETVTTPAGTFSNVLHVREQRGNGYARDVWYAPGVGMVKMSDGTNAGVLMGYTIPGAVAQPGGGAAPLAFIPVAGMWWNPAESGTGYNIQVQHGTLVATIFAYAGNGDPMWYLIVGSMANAGAGIATTATLDKYRGGQCASCLYRMPSTMGNDGSMTITFSSPTAATVQLNGGRVTQIQPYAW